MASQILHDLLDDLENAVSPVKGLVASAESRITAAITALRAHAEKLTDQVGADAATAAHTLAGQVAADAAPIVTDVESGVRDLAQSAEQAAAAPAEATAPESTDPQPAA